MSAGAIGALLLVMFFVLVFCNVPIAVSLGVSSVIALLILDFPLSIVGNLVYAGIGKFVLLAIPYFILAGVIMDYAGISKRLVNFAQTCVGHRRGGLAYVTVLVACLFAAISGSGPATVAALGGILIPAMVNAGYDRGMSTALVSASGGIGIIIPPSIAFVVYAVMAEVSVSRLFAAGILPGILVGISFMIASKWSIRKNNDLKLIPKATGKERWEAFKGAFWGLMTPVIILGGIYSGLFTPTEAAGVACVYGLIVGIFIYKEIKLKDCWKMVVEAAASSASVMFIISTATIFAWVLTTAHIASTASAALLSVSSNKYVLMLLMNIILLIAGCFIDASSATYIFLPIMLPIARVLGIDLVHFGVFVVVNFAIGLITPPVGLNLYVGASIGNVTVNELARKMVPFIIASIISLLIITYVPQISLFLPNLFGAK